MLWLRDRLHGGAARLADVSTCRASGAVTGSSGALVAGTRSKRVHDAPDTHGTPPWREWLTAYATLEGLNIRTHLGLWIRGRRPRFGTTFAPRFAGAPAGLAGLPLRRTQGLPVGLSFISAPGHDERLLDLAVALSPA